MFVTIKRYLEDWKHQRKINCTQKAINDSQNKAIAALQRRVDKLERQSGYLPPAGGPVVQPQGGVWFGGRPGPSTKGECDGGLIWSDEHGGYIGPGGGADDELGAFAGPCSGGR